MTTSTSTMKRSGQCTKRASASDDGDSNKRSQPQNQPCHDSVEESTKKLDAPFSSSPSTPCDCLIAEKSKTKCCQDGYCYPHRQGEEDKVDVSISRLLLEDFDYDTQHFLKLAACLGPHLFLPLLEEYFDHFITNGTSTSRTMDDIVQDLVKHNILHRTDKIPILQRTSSSSSSTSLTRLSTVGDEGGDYQEDDEDEQASTASSSDNVSICSHRCFMYQWPDDSMQQTVKSLLLPSETERHHMHHRLGNLASELLLSTSFSRSRSSSTSRYDTLPPVSSSQSRGSPIEHEALTYIAADQFNQVPIDVIRKLSSDGKVPEEEDSSIVMIKKPAATNNTTFLRLARLNLQAAKLSITKSAFYPAAKLLRAGKAVLVAISDANGRNSGSPKRVSSKCSTSSTIDDSTLETSTATADDPSSSRIQYCWLNHYDLCLELHINLIETCYAIGQQKEAKDAIEEVLSNGRTREDKFRARSCLLEIAVNGKDRDEGKGARMCLEFLKSYGYDIPHKPSKLNIYFEKQRLKKLLTPTGTLDDILLAPVATDKAAICASVFLGKVSVFALLSGNFSLAVLSSLYHVRHAKAYGVTMHTALSLAMIAVVEAQSGGNRECFRHSDLPLNLMNRLNRCNGTSVDETLEMASGSSLMLTINSTKEKNRNHSLCSQILVIVHAGIMQFFKPFQDGLNPFMEAYHHGIQAGDFEHAFCGAMNYGYVYAFVGLPLSHFESDMASFGEESSQLGLVATIQAQFTILRLTALKLMGRSQGDRTILAAEGIDQETVLSKVEGKGQSMTFRDICTFRLVLAYIYGDLDVSANMIDTLSEFPTFNPMIVRMHLRQAFTGLAAYALSRKSTSRQSRKRFRGIAEGVFKYFQKAVKKGSINAYPIYTLLLAVKSPSKQKFDEAIRSCCRSGFKNFEAVAFELCGIWLLEEGNDEYWSTFYLSHAVERYKEWEAYGKVDQLRRTYSLDESTSFLSSVGTSCRGKKVHQGWSIAKTRAIHLDDLTMHQADHRISFDLS